MYRRSIFGIAILVLYSAPASAQEQQEQQTAPEISGLDRALFQRLGTRLMDRELDQAGRKVSHLVRDMPTSLNRLDGFKQAKQIARRFLSLEGVTDVPSLPLKDGGKVVRDDNKNLNVTIKGPYGMEEHVFSATPGKPKTLSHLLSTVTLGTRSRRVHNSGRWVPAGQKGAIVTKDVVAYYREGASPDLFSRTFVRNKGPDGKETKNWLEHAYHLTRSGIRHSWSQVVVNDQSSGRRSYRVVKPYGKEVSLAEHRFDDTIHSRLLKRPRYKLNYSRRRPTRRPPAQRLKK